MKSFVWWLTLVKESHPELRVCQILSIAASKGGWQNSDLFYCPDDVILKGLQQMAD